MQSAKCKLVGQLKDRDECVRNKQMEIEGSKLECCCTPR